MAQNKKAKTADRNEDPITGEPGAHPVGVGLGTAGGAAAGAAGGAVLGPVGAVVGAVIGGVAGGLAGKGVAEAIDPTEEDRYWRKHYRTRPYFNTGEKYETYQPAYHYGISSQQKYATKSFDDAEAGLKRGWNKARGESTLDWDRARDAVRDAYDRTIQLREEQLQATKTPVKKGEVKVRKEVVTEHQTIDVPVEREEVVIERRPVSRRAANADFRAEEVRIPVSGEQVRADKRTVVKEEVSVGKRKVQDTEKVSGAVRKENLRVEESGKVKVRGNAARKPSR
ncbi:MAG: YsnF/AvaK domain-containing protein [Planctomycetia bacterium]|nr:YsnF/AvaK domain-containing protein [Planctomycetia bacterium]